MLSWLCLLLLNNGDVLSPYLWHILTTEKAFGAESFSRYTLSRYFYRYSCYWSFFVNLPRINIPATKMAYITVVTISHFGTICVYDLMPVHPIMPINTPRKFNNLNLYATTRSNSLIIMSTSSLELIFQFWSCFIWRLASRHCLIPLEQSSDFLLFYLKRFHGCYHYNKYPKWSCHLSEKQHAYADYSFSLFHILNCNCIASVWWSLR